jgi:uncharacterized membrane protein YesL
MSEILSIVPSINTVVTLIAFLIAIAAYVVVKAHGTRQWHERLSSAHVYRLMREEIRNRRLILVLLFVLLLIIARGVIPFLRP